jgi:putative tryptophan/tyrosine transport system substrate-binding protein
MPFDRLGRRDFITLLGRTAVAWPVVVRAEQGQRIRRVSVLMPVNEDEPDNRSGVTAFVEVLKKLSSAEGHNVQIDTTWGKNDPQETRRLAEQLVALAPDVLVTSGDATMAPVLRSTRTVPVVFNNVTDPVGAGFVESLAEPGGNATGFLRFEYTLAGKWLELLKLVASRTTRVAVLRDSDTAGGIGQFAVIQSVAPSVGIDVAVINLHDARQIERAVSAFARKPNGGLILTASAPSVVHRELIITLAAQHKLPTVYYRRSFVAGGGLISYGYDLVQQFRDTAGYVHRILKGEKPSNLPVQAPTKYEMVINLKTATALGLDVTPTLLVRADEAIE